MRIVTRYVLGELLKTFLGSLAAVTLFILLVLIVRQALAEGLGIKQILFLIPYILPDALRMTIPATALFAVCNVFGRMAASNEIVALKSLGVSPLVVLWPVYVLAFFLSLVSVWLNDVAVSWGRSGVRQVIVSSVKDIAYSRLRTKRNYSSKGFSINVHQVEGRRLIAPTFTYVGADDDASVTVRCEFAELDSDGDFLTIKCFNGTVDIGGQVSYRFPDYIVREVPLEKFLNNDSVGGPSWQPLHLIHKNLALEEQNLRHRERGLAMKAAFQLLSGDLKELTSPEWESQYRDLDHHYYLYHRYRTEPPRRWSAGFSCVCFVLVGSVMAIRLRNANFLTSFFVCFLPILVVYYPLLMIGVDQAKAGHLPPDCVWLGNVALVGWGFWLLRKVLRY
jgi:lipopolysaccharide export system permease protein